MKSIFTALIFTICTVGISWGQHPKVSLPTKSIKNLYKLQSGEMFSSGYIGVNEFGIITYTLVEVKKYDPNKIKFYNNRGNGNLSQGTPSEDEKYDYWIIYNGNKFGPYDKIINLPNPIGTAKVDHMLNPKANTINFTGIKADKYYPVINNNDALWYTNDAGAPIFAVSPDGSQSTYGIYYRKDTYYV